MMQGPSSRDGATRAPFVRAYLVKGIFSMAADNYCSPVGGSQISVRQSIDPQRLAKEQTKIHT